MLKLECGHCHREMRSMEPFKVVNDQYLGLCCVPKDKSTGDLVISNSNEPPKPRFCTEEIQGLLKNINWTFVESRDVKIITLFKFDVFKHKMGNFMYIFKDQSWTCRHNDDLETPDYHSKADISRGSDIVKDLF